MSNMLLPVATVILLNLNLPVSNLIRCSPNLYRNSSSLDNSNFKPDAPNFMYMLMLIQLAAIMTLPQHPGIQSSSLRAVRIVVLE